MACDNFVYTGNAFYRQGFTYKAFAIDSNGDIWVACRSLDGYYLQVHKMTSKDDPATWVQRGADELVAYIFSTPAGLSNIWGLHAEFDSSDILHIAFLVHHDDPYTNWSLCYINFDPSTDTYGTQQWLMENNTYVIRAPQLIIRGSEQFIFITIQDASYYRSYYYKRSGGSWGSSTDLDTGTPSANQFLFGAVMGDSSRIHIAIGDDTNSLIKYCTLNSSDSLSTLRTISQDIYSTPAPMYPMVTTWEGDSNKTAVFWCELSVGGSPHMHRLEIPSTSDDPTYSSLTDMGYSTLGYPGWVLPTQDDLFILLYSSGSWLLSVSSGGNVTTYCTDIGAALAAGIFFVNSAGETLYFDMSGRLMNLGVTRPQAFLNSDVKSHAAAPGTVDGDLFQEATDTAITSHTSDEGYTWSEGTTNDASFVVEGATGKLRIGKP